MGQLRLLTPYSSRSDWLPKKGFPDRLRDGGAPGILSNGALQFGF